MELLKPKTILAAVDLGAETEQVLSYALWLAKSAPVVPDIDLLYVLDYGFTPPAYLAPYIEKEKAAEERNLEKLENRLNALGVRTRRTIAMGRLTETFIKTVRETGADIVVIGHKSHLVRPSSSERLIKFLEVPLLVVRGKKSSGASLDGLNIKRILCAVDFSDNSRKALDYALSLSDACSSGLIVVHAVPMEKFEKRLQKWQDLSEDERSRAVEDLARETEEKMRSFVGNSADAEKIVKTGLPYEVITNAAEEKDADLIVLGARGLSYVGGLMLGSVSESVIRSSPCPVMVIR